MTKPLINVEIERLLAGALADCPPAEVADALLAYGLAVGMSSAGRPATIRILVRLAERLTLDELGTPAAKMLEETLGQVLH